MPQQIELRNIALQAAQPLVHGVSLTLQRGRVLALVGGSCLLYTSPSPRDS